MSRAFTAFALVAAAVVPTPAAAQCACAAEDALVVGHRGDGTGAGENTVPAAERAFAAGADMVEVDVQLSADGAVVLMHDATVDRTTDGAGCVGALTFEELSALDAGGAPVPTLSELFAATDGGVNVEVKLHDTDGCPAQDLDALADAVVAAIEADAGARPIVVSSFELGVLQRIRATAPTVRIALLSTTPDAIDVATSEGFEQVNLLAAVVSARTMRQVRAAELDVHVRTIDGEDTVRDFLGRGVDGVITDTVPAAVAARAAFCEAYVCPVADAGTPSPDDAGVSPDGGGGCSVGRSRAAPWLALILLFPWLRRRLGYPGDRCPSES